MIFFELNNFSCGYPSFSVTDINFKINKGSFVGIIGPNGSGKTTLLKGITNVVKRNNGDVFINNISLSKMSLIERAKNIAIVNQTVDAGQITVLDYVLMGRIPYQSKFQFFESKKDIEIAKRNMELTGVAEYQNKLMTELSGGEQQRAAIARALTQEPKLLLLDEPTSHLDITHQVRILNLLQELNEKLRLTVVMVIHDLNLASEYCDHLILFNKGKIHMQGSPKEVITYKNIEDVYKTPVITQENPYSKKPTIFLVSNKMIKSILNK